MNGLPGRPAIVLVLWALSAGCASTAPSRFYLLDPLATPEGAASPAAGDISIGVGPVKLPGYLERPQIVTRDASPEISVAEFDRWAEPLSENFVRVLGENLSTLLGTDLITVFPWRGTHPLDYRVTVDVTRLDGELGGNAVLSARWAVGGKTDAEPVIVKKTTLTEPVNGGYEDFVAAHSRLLEALSREIAAEIKTASRVR